MGTAKTIKPLTSLVCHLHLAVRPTAHRITEPLPGGNDLVIVFQPNLGIQPTQFSCFRLILLKKKTQALGSL